MSQNIKEQLSLLNANEKHFAKMAMIQDVEGMIQQILIDSTKGKIDYMDVMNKVIFELGEMHRKEMAKVNENLDKLAELNK